MVLTTAAKVRQARLAAGLSHRELAALASVSPSMISRTEAGLIEPRAAAYSAILLAAGFADLGNDIGYVSQTQAIATARWLAGDLPVMPPRAQDWILPWRRLGLLSEDDSILDLPSLAFRAGRAAVLSARTASVTCLGVKPATEVAQMLNSAGIWYALTCDYALAALGAPIVPTTRALYVRDLAGATEALNLTPSLPGQMGPALKLFATDGYCDQGASVVSGIRFVSPLQAIIDGCSSGGRSSEQALSLVESWRHTP